MTRDRWDGGQPRALCSGLGGPAPTWLSPPPESAVGLAAATWLQHRVACRLAEMGITAARLSEQIGGSESGWRGKLNGNRVLALTDMLEIAIALDGDLFSLFPGVIDDIAELLPPEYTDWLSHRRPGGGMPKFRAHNSINWLEVAAESNQWWSTERVSGRGWTLSGEVLLNKIVAIADSYGLPSTTSAHEVARTGSILVEWLGGDVELQLYAQHVSEDAVGRTEVRTLLSEVGSLLRDVESDFTVTDKIIVIALPRNARSALLELVSAQDGRGSDLILTSQQLRQLGVSTDGWKEIGATQLSGKDDPLVWLTVKSNETIRL